jgi:hypothetical protein
MAGRVSYSLCSVAKHHKPEFNHDNQPTGDRLLDQSRVESDRKFWSGERPLSIVQASGLLLIVIALIAVVVRPNYRSFAWVMGGLIFFVVVGNRWARRRYKPNSKG